MSRRRCSTALWSSLRVPHPAQNRAPMVMNTSGTLTFAPVIDPPGSFGVALSPEPPSSPAPALALLARGRGCDLVDFLEPRPPLMALSSLGTLLPGDALRAWRGLGFLTDASPPSPRGPLPPLLVLALLLGAVALHGVIGRLRAAASRSRPRQTLLPAAICPAALRAGERNVFPGVTECHESPLGMPARRRRPRLANRRHRRTFPPPGTRANMKRGAPARFDRVSKPFSRSGSVDQAMTRGPSKWKSLWKSFVSNRQSKNAGFNRVRRYLIIETYEYIV